MVFFHWYGVVRYHIVVVEDMWMNMYVETLDGGPSAMIYIYEG